jgi:hypothetical protein
MQEEWSDPTPGPAAIVPWLAHRPRRIASAALELTEALTRLPSQLSSQMYLLGDCHSKNK